MSLTGKSAHPTDITRQRFLPGCRKRCVSIRRAMFHARMLPSQLALNNSNPSGENTTLRTESACPANKAISNPVATSHNRTLQSSPAEAICLPSGEKVAHRTSPKWPAYRCSSSRVEMSVSRTILSVPPVRSCLPSGGTDSRTAGDEWRSCLHHTERTVLAEILVEVM